MHSVAEKIYSVFVSSTFEDLREERSEVQKAILRAKCFPIGMELFPSTDEETWDFIKRQIDDADFYLVVVAGRYGSVSFDGVSYTEKEYDYARRIGKPTLAFIHADRNQIKFGDTDQNDDKRQMLEKFIAKIQERPLVNRYSSPHELGLQVLASITNLKESGTKAIGFVRANQVADYKRYADALEEISTLRTALEKAERNKTPSFPESASILTFKVVIRKEGEDAIVNRSVSISWRDLFLAVAFQIIQKANTSDDNIYRVILDKAVGKLEDKTWSYFHDGDAFSQIKSTLFARNLINFEVSRREKERFGEVKVVSTHYWVLTEDGKNLYRSLMYGD